jgi:AcrR family transcriptional regulator
MDPGPPKFRRRKADRPREILDAALVVFAEKGFAAARLDEIARRAGVSKGALYLYFETKEDIFRAAVGQVIAPDIATIRVMAGAHTGPFSDLIQGVAFAIGHLAQTSPLGGVAKMVLGEARNFPELARVWHDELVAQALGAITEAVEAAQGRGEVRAGDPRTFALQFIAPLLVGVMWRETFVPIGAEAFSLPDLMSQHVETLLHGMLTPEARS